MIDGADVPIAATRELLDELCAPLLGRLRALLDSCLASSTGSLGGVETCGGGTRMPSVQAALADALRASDAGARFADEKPGAKLDDASIAIGAAIVARARLDAADGAAPAAPNGAADSADAPESGLLSASELAEAVDAEARLAARDLAVQAVGARRNEFEAFVLDSRGVRARKHGELVDGSKLEPLLDAAEEWMYSDEGEAADLGQLDAKLAELKVHVGELMAAYEAKVAEGRAADEQASEPRLLPSCPPPTPLAPSPQALEAASAAAAAEKAARGEEDEDHDTRKLKFPDRMRLVVKNKEEGTELFQGGNFRPAAARYNKALTHAAKFIDLSPDQKEEARHPPRGRLIPSPSLRWYTAHGLTQVNKLKLSLHLNIAMCWLKITDSPNHLEQVNCPPFHCTQS